MVAVGMSRLIRMVTLRESLLPIVTGSIMIYVSGFEKRLYLDGAGVHQMRAFWGRKKEKQTEWSEITDARVILNKGKNIYVLLHGADKIPPLTLNRSKAEKVIALFHERLPEDKVFIEK